ncbi:AMP-binding protein [Sorangium sp. So ce315]|uniref:AMP-binding protein n=1 Tax=Sorangium sp. So ce315 TaxID=3133299 RepID=UPI003F5F23E3
MSEEQLHPTFARVISENRGHADGGFTFLQEGGQEHFLSWAALSQEALRRGHRLRRRGLRKGDRVALLIPEAEEFVLTFLGAISAGIVPVPMGPPLAFGRLAAYLEDAAGILRKAGARALVSTSSLASVSARLLEEVIGLEHIAADDWAASPWTTEAPRAEDVAPEDVMFLQFTSGSTAAPKGVRVTHASALANCAAIAAALRLDGRRDKGVSWLPMYHDMGLVGFVLAPFLVRCPVVFIPTLRFALDPGVWMETVSRHRGTVTFAPNFGLAVAVKHAPEEALARLDLSCLRVVGCGAEPNHPATLRAFLAHFARARLRPEVLLPCYGMAEATLAMAFSDVGAPLAVDVIQREPYHARRIARPASAEDPAEGLLHVVACGRALPGHCIAILDEAGHELPERRVGEVVFRGPSTAGGYHEDPASTRRAFTAAGLRTGDRGYLADGVLYVTGRDKDLLVINGRNDDPQTVEWAAAEIAGLRRGSVVAFTRPSAVTEELVIVAETRERDVARLAKQVRSHVQAELSLPVADVVLVAPDHLPKTTSGKLQRNKARQQYMDGSLCREGSRAL